MGGSFAPVMIFFDGLWWIWSVGGLFASIFFDDFLWWFDGLTVGFAPMILFIYLWFDGLCVEPVLEVDGEREEKKMTVGKLRKMWRIMPSLEKGNRWKEIIKKD